MRKTPSIVVVLLVLVATCFPAVRVTAAMSPGAGKLIFEGWGLPEILGVVPSYEIWAVNEDGSGLTNLTDSPGYDGDAAWSPDRTKIAFDSNRAGNDDIYVMNHDGTRQRRLTSSRASELWPQWSPDGQRIAYSRGTQLWVMNADGSEKRKIFTSAAERVMPSDWSPDGRWIAFHVGNHPANTDWDIYVIRPNGSVVKKFMSTNLDEGGVQWSPDGSSVVFYRLLECNAVACNWDIFTARAGGSGEKNITDTPYNGEYDAVWSPDGTTIAYADEYGTTGWEADIFVMNADGTDRRHLVPKPDSFDYGVDW